MTSIGEKKRSQILSAALKVFAQNGFNGASIQMIADAAALPKANVLYYFTSKSVLYSEVIQSILSMWNVSFDQVTALDCPAQSLAKYIAEKMEISRLHPYSSKVFAIEMINGAKNVDDAFKARHIEWVKGRIEVIKAWKNAGKIDVVNPEYLLYQIWASTQHYADFSAQIEQLRKRPLDEAEFAEASKTVIHVILKGCGLNVPDEYI